MGDISNEGQLQAAFFTWLHDWNKFIWDITFHVPNGGYRHPAEAMNLKRQGVKPGVPDVFCPVVRPPYHGLFIEFKWNKNKPSAHQTEMMARLEQEGYLCKLCYSLPSAQRIMNEYILGIKSHV